MAGCTTQHAKGDADLDIAKAAKQLGEAWSATVIGEDT